VDLSFRSNPTGLQLTVGSSASSTEFTRTVIVGISDEFVSWSDGGAAQPRGGRLGHGGHLHGALPVSVGRLHVRAVEGELLRQPDAVGCAAWEQCEAAVDYDWDLGGPIGVGTDNFSVRWVKPRTSPPVPTRSPRPPMTGSGCAWMAPWSSTNGKTSRPPLHGIPSGDDRQPRAQGGVLRERRCRRRQARDLAITGTSKHPAPRRRPSSRRPTPPSSSVARTDCWTAQGTVETAPVVLMQRACMAATAAGRHIPASTSGAIDRVHPPFIVPSGIGQDRSGRTGRAVHEGLQASGGVVDGDPVDLDVLGTGGPGRTA
jgi:hypothetical protein